MSRKPPLHNEQRSRKKTSSGSQALLAGKREEKEAKKLVAIKQEKDKPNTLTEKLDRTSKEQQEQYKGDVRTQTSHRQRPRHGDNRWRRNLALVRYPTPPERSNPFNNHYRYEVRRASCDFQLSEGSSSNSNSSDSSQDENATSCNNSASLTTLQPSPSPCSLHPNFTSSSTHCSPIYRRRTIPTITVTDTDRRRLSPLMLRNHDYMQRVQVLSHSMPMLFRSKSDSPQSGQEMANDHHHPAAPKLARSRPGSGRSSVVKLPPISPMPHPLTASCNSTKSNDITGIRTTLLM